MILAPRPAIAKPQRRQQMQLRRFRPAIMDADLDEDVLGRFLGVFHEHVEVAILVKDAGLQEFILKFVPAAALVGADQLPVGIRGLRILVEILQVGMRRRAIEVKIIFLHVLAMIALAVRQPEQAFLQDGIFAVPECERETQPLAIVRNPGQTVFAPPISAGMRLLVAQIIPGVAVLAVVLAHRAPLAFTEVWPPLLPRRAGLAGGFESLLFSIHMVLLFIAAAERGRFAGVSLSEWFFMGTFQV